MITLSIADLRRCRACELPARVADLTRHLGRVPADDEAISLATWWALHTTSVPDMWWSLGAAQPAEAAKRVAVVAACRAVRRVLPLARPRDRAICEAAILAAEGWLAGTHTVEQCREAMAAAEEAARDVRARAPWSRAAQRADLIELLAVEGGAP